MLKQANQLPHGALCLGSERASRAKILPRNEGSPLVIVIVAYTRRMRGEIAASSEVGVRALQVGIGIWRTYARRT
jgi:hypothetical protein